MSRLLDAIRRRPHRAVAFVVALLGLATAFGLDFTDEQQAAIVAVVTILVGASEAAQTRTTPLADPHGRDGRPLAPVNGINGERGAD